MRFGGSKFAHLAIKLHSAAFTLLTPSHSAKADGTLHRGAAAPTLIVASGHPVLPAESLILACTESLILACTESLIFVGNESLKRADTESLIQN